MYKYKKLSSADFDAVLSVLRQQFGDDIGIVNGSLDADFRSCIEYCLFEGDSRGVVIDSGELVGCVLMTNYAVLPEDVFCKFFGCSSFKDAPNRGIVHSALRKMMFVEYIFSVVAPGAVIDFLISEVVSEFNKFDIVSDTMSKPAVVAYQKAGFKAVQIGFGHWYVSRQSG